MGTQHGQSKSKSNGCRIQPLASTTSEDTISVDSNKLYRRAMLQNHKTSPSKHFASDGHKPTLSTGSGSWPQKSPRSWHPEFVYRTAQCTYTNITTVRTTNERPHWLPDQYKCQSFSTRSGPGRTDIPNASGNHGAYDWLVVHSNMVSMSTTTDRDIDNNQGPRTTTGRW